MKEKTIEKSEVKKLTTRRQGLIGNIQLLGDTYIINIFHNRILHYRYCFNLETNEYKTLDVMNGFWKQEKIMSMTCDNYTSYYSWSSKKILKWENEKEAKEIAQKICEDYEFYKKTDDLIDALDTFELKANRDKRERVYRNKADRINDMIARTPLVSETKVLAWAMHMINPQHYLMKTKEGCSCTKCGSSIESNAKRGQTVICPQCNEVLKVKSVSPDTEISASGMICLIQDTEFETMVRHIDCEVYDRYGQARRINRNEAVRIVIDTVKRKGEYQERTSIYHSQNLRRDYYTGRINDRSLNDGVSLWDTNPYNRKIKAEYLYPDNIEENLSRTSYSSASKLLKYMADNGLKADYNRIMYVADKPSIINTLEYLAKGRFYRLTEECSENICFWNGKFDSYKVSIHAGDDIFETLFISDKQLINRLRDKDGGNNMLRLLQWCDIENLKIPDEALEYFEKSKIRTENLVKLSRKIKITPLAIANYIKKQKKESYQSFQPNTILEQWIDYLEMMERLDKPFSQELFYKPKNLKQRHGELVEEINSRARELELKDNVKIANQQAKEYREKFPQAEKILEDIKTKFEYTGERMSILVPKDLSEIIADGRTLHHCAGATNRYFDRIENKETFICFLRKNECIDIPYYTIEVEPGGTIRQHRGMYDEEPELETVKPFLKEWQGVIKKRMSKADKELAKISKIKREANIEDLKAKNNTFVLRGLMEDFMEA